MTVPSFTGPHTLRACNLLALQATALLCEYSIQLSLDHLSYRTSHSEVGPLLDLTKPILIKQLASTSQESRLLVTPIVHCRTYFQTYCSTGCNSIDHPKTSAPTLSSCPWMARLPLCLSPTLSGKDSFSLKTILGTPPLGVYTGRDVGTSHSPECIQASLCAKWNLHGAGPKGPSTLSQKRKKLNLGPKVGWGNPAKSWSSGGHFFREPHLASLLLGTQQLYSNPGGGL